ncbi:MAG TPA: AraC family transcriptional regulator [Puia sp.]
MPFYRQYQPGVRLSDLIECYWVYRSSGVVSREERLIPGGRVEMIFPLGTSYRWLIHPEAPEGDLISRVHFMGQRDRIYFGRPSGHTDMLGVRFKPGGLAAFTSVPVSGLLNRMIPAEEILGTGIKEWEERLSEGMDDRARIFLLEKLLSGIIRDQRAGPGMLTAALAIIRDHPDEVSIQAICQQTGWYYKKLERAFKGAIGYTPKQYCRIIRFNKAIRQISRDKSSSLTKVGYACGYYDQSHFIRDFYRYAGMAPGSWEPEDQSIADFLIRYQPV